MRLPRSSGLLLPVFSLPGRFGIGDLGPAAFEFVDFLAQAGQTIWQVLPLSPTARGHSPYSSYSAFAGNALLISPEQLHRDGLLSSAELADAEADDASSDRVNYTHADHVKERMLRRAFNAFQQQGHAELHDRFEAFRAAHSHWLHDACLYEASARHHRELDWSLWNPSLVRRDTGALNELEQALGDEIRYSEFVQFLFQQQWQDVKDYANQHNIRIYGDMPIFVAYESADVWMNQHLFSLDENARPDCVAGVPPDYFSSTGQKWGNPLYRWDRLRESGYAWWIDRMRHALNHFDLLRLDHFRGFESYWAIPAEADNAICGEWREGPRDDFFHKAADALGELPIVAEDLGLITDEVHWLRDRLGFPGMRVLQFGFEHEHDGYHRPDCYPEHSVAYTGTHDNDTTMGWFQSRFSQERSHLIKRFLNGGDAEIHWDLIDAVLHSASDTAIIPLQDVAALDSSARMNTPGVPDGNWSWRCESPLLNDETADSLRSRTAASGRI